MIPFLINPPKRGGNMYGDVRPARRNGNRAGDATTTTTSPTRTSTSTSTEAYTRGNITVTGGAGRGATTRVQVNPRKRPASPAQLRQRRRFAAAARKKARAAKAATRSRRRTARRSGRSTGARQMQETAMARRKRRKRPVKAASRRRRRSGARRRRRSPVTTLRRRAVYATNRPRRRRRHRANAARRRRSYRRNPGFSPKGAIASLMRAGKTAAFVVVGKAVTNMVADRIPFGGNSRIANAAKKAGVGLVLSIFGRRFVGPANADAMLVGAIMAPIEELAAGLPLIGPALSPTPVVVIPPVVPTASGYFQRPGSGVRGYFQPGQPAGLRGMAGDGSDEYYSG